MYSGYSFVIKTLIRGVNIGGTVFFRCERRREYFRYDLEFGADMKKYVPIRLPLVTMFVGNMSSDCEVVYKTGIIQS